MVFEPAVICGVGIFEVPFEVEESHSGALAGHKPGNRDSANTAKDSCGHVVAYLSACWHFFCIAHMLQTHTRFDSQPQAVIAALYKDLPCPVS